MYKAIKDNKIIAISNTDSEFKFMVKDSVEIDEEHTTADYTMVGSEYVLNDDEKAIKLKKEQVRAIRNSYLADTDKYMIVDFPISDQEREEYKGYREYLRNYTKIDKWYENNPVDFQTWKQDINDSSDIDENEKEE